MKSAAKGPGSYPGTIRIIGGVWGSRQLQVPDSLGLRPTPNRVRETLFNWLQPWLPGARCLDVTAGTGVLCLEALSRGAGSALMVEQSLAAVQALCANIERLGADNAQVRHGDGAAFLQRPPDAPFDIIFLDPPFRSDLIERCARLLETNGWIRPDGLIYIEAPSHVEELPIPANWTLIRSKRAGQVGYHLVRREAPKAGAD